MFSKLALFGLLALAVIANCEDAEEPAKYTFQYAVNDPVTGDSKAQEETRDGDVLQGYYQVLEPTGNLRTVQYVSDPEGGFRATVSNGAPGAAPKVAAPPAPVVKYAPPPVVKPVVPVAPAYPYSAYPYSAYPYSGYPYAGSAYPYSGYPYSAYPYSAYPYSGYPNSYYKSGYPSYYPGYQYPVKK